MDISFFQMLYIFLAAAIGETFGVIFGGGGFLIQPALLAAGISPQHAIANDIAAATFSGIAFLIFFRLPNPSSYRKARQISLWTAPTMILGAIIGGNLLAIIPTVFLKWMILVICCGGLAYTLMKIRHVHIDLPHDGKYIPYWQVAALCGGLVLGLYTGVSGAGGGILKILLLSLIFRQQMKTTIFCANIIGIASLGTASLTYLYLGLLRIELLAFMIPATLVAGFIGAKITHFASEKTLRIIFACILSVLIIYLLSQYLSP